MEMPGRAPEMTGPSTGYSPPERSLRTGLSMKGTQAVQSTLLGQPWSTCFSSLLLTESCGTSR